MPSQNNLTDPDLVALADRILKDSGFDIKQYKERPLKRRLAVRMRACQVNRYEAYRQKLKDDPAEYLKLLDALTINVTKFYRNNATYQIVFDKVFPTMVKENRGQPLKIWSAGCSSGEEPYSLSILWKEFSEINDIKIPCTVYATDIDIQILMKAKQGIYNKSSMDEIPKRLIDKYFDFTNDKYHISAQIKSMVHFEKLDLFSKYPFSNIDMIFCRNVLIYFSRETQENIFMKFAAVLRPAGFLVLGKVENIFGRFKDVFISFDNKERIYRTAN